MKPKILIGIIASIGLCSGIYAQIINPRTNNEDLCDLCQPHTTSSCVTYIIYPEGEAGIHYCGPGVNIYDSEPKE